MKPSQLTTPQLMALLRKRYASREYAFLEQVRSRTGYGGKIRTADALVMSLWPSRGLEISGFELKVSRSDWLHEKHLPEKADEIYQFCDRWWLVISHEHILHDGELPPTWGLLLANCAKLSTKVEAPKLSCLPLSRPALASILRNVDNAKANMVPKDEIADLIHNAKEEGRAEGAKTDSTALGWELSQLREEKDRLKTAIKVFEDASGLRFDTWGKRPQELGEAVRLVEQISLDGTIDQIEAQFNWAIKALDRFEKTLREVKAKSTELRAPYKSGD